MAAACPVATGCRENKRRFCGFLRLDDATRGEVFEDSFNGGLELATVSIAAAFSASGQVPTGLSGGFEFSELVFLDGFERQSAPRAEVAFNHFDIESPVQRCFLR